MGIGIDYYLKAGKASDLEKTRERTLYRFFEIFPGLLTWSAIVFSVFLSWKFPLLVSFFIIGFAMVWFFRTLYFCFYLWIGYQRVCLHQKINWVEKLNSLKSYSLPTITRWQDVYQVIVIPMYLESREIIGETLQSIADNDYPKNRVIVVLACEEKVKKTIEGMVGDMQEEFKKKFRVMMVTWHPFGLPGEVAGKGSNETWAAKEVQKIIHEEQIPYEHILFSSFDADTKVPPQYFTCLTYHYVTAKNPLRTSFQPVPLYLNNIWQAPVFSKLISFSSTFWHIMGQERVDKIITFSSHSMGFKSLVEVGFKQTNVVSDDSRIFWQCFLHYRGDYWVEPLYYPLSMDANMAGTWKQTFINLYKQQRRWAYGVGDIPYFLFAFYKDHARYKSAKKQGIKVKKIPFRKKVSLAFDLIEGHFSWALAGLLIFFLGWLPIILGGALFTHSIISYNLPKVVGQIMSFAMVGVLTSCYVSMLILPPRPKNQGWYNYLIFAVSWIISPILMMFFISIPALDAQTRWMLGKYMGFWPTEKVRKN